MAPPGMPYSDDDYDPADPRAAEAPYAGLYGTMAPAADDAPPPPAAPEYDEPVMTGDDGQPVIANGQPLTYARYYALQAAASGGGMTPEQRSAALGSSMLNAGIGVSGSASDPVWLRQKAEFGAYYGNPGLVAEAAGQMGGVLGQQQDELSQRARQIQALRQQVMSDPDMDDRSRAATLGHLYRQEAGLQQHWQRTQQQGQRVAAISAGLHPDYGTPGGPELDPRSRQQLQDAEFAVQQVRNDPSLSAQQKVAAVQTLSNRIQQIDPAGRYRNGQNPLSPIQRAVAQMAYTDPDSGVIYTLDGRGNVKATMPRQQRQDRATSFAEMDPDKRYKLLTDHMEKFGITDPRVAYQHMMQLDSLFGVGQGQGDGQGQQGGFKDGYAAGMAFPQSVQQNQALRQQQGGGPQGYGPPVGGFNAPGAWPMTVKQMQDEQKRQDLLDERQGRRDDRRQAAQDRQAKAQQASQDRINAGLDRADAADQTRQKQAWDYAERRGRYAAAQQVKGTKDPAPEADPDRVRQWAQEEYGRATLGKGVLGVPISHVETHNLGLKIDPALQQAQAAGDTDSAHHLTQLKELLTTYPRGVKAMSPLERGYYVHGMWALGAYDRSVRPPKFSDVGAVDPRDQQGDQ